MLYEALTGRLPFAGAAFEVLMDKQKLDPPAPSSLVPGLPDDLAALCVELLRRDPEARPMGGEVLRRLGSAADRPEVAGTGAVRPCRPGVSLVGREHHLKVLDAAFRAMKQGRTVTCSVQGRSGVGKSALVQHFLDALSGATRPWSCRAAATSRSRCRTRRSIAWSMP